MKKKVLILFTLMIIICISFSGCTETDENENKKIEVEDFELKKIEKNLPPYDDSWEATGKVINIFDYTLDTIEVRVRYYDLDNYFLDSKSTMTRYLPSGETWNFTITYNKDDSNEDIVDDIHHAVYDLTYSQ